jgi:hypothetical protein
MKYFLLLAFYLMFAIVQTSTAQQSKKRMFIQGLVKDSLGNRIRDERILLINQKGKVKKMILTDYEGKFSFKIRSSKINSLSIKCVSDYVSAKQMSMSSFINTDGSIVLEFDLKQVIRCGGIFCPVSNPTQDLNHMPCNYQTADMVRFFPMVK